MSGPAILYWSGCIAAFIVLTWLALMMGVDAFIRRRRAGDLNERVRDAFRRMAKSKPNEIVQIDNDVAAYLTKHSWRIDNGGVTIVDARTPEPVSVRLVPRYDDTH